MSFHPRKTLLWGGNGGGKSAVVKSLFRAFDAEPHGQIDYWDYSAIIAVDFEVAGRTLTVVRREDIRALFEGNQILGVATSSLEWNKVFADAVGFELHLLDRKGRFRPAAPGNYFLPFFINQDGSFGSSWDTFDSLEQFKTFAQHTVEYFTGVRPAQYFELKSREQSAKSKEAELRVELATLGRTRVRVKKNLKTIPIKLSEKEFQTEVRELSVRLNALVKDQDEVRRRILEDQELQTSLNDQIQLSVGALSEHKADFKVAASASAQGEKYTCPTCHAEHHESFHSLLGLSEDARELHVLKTHLEDLLKTTRVRLERSRQKAALLKQEYAQIQTLLNVKRGKYTFDDFLKSRSAYAVDAQLGAEEQVVQKEIDAQLQVLRDIKEGLRTVADEHDSQAPTEAFRMHLANAFAQLNVPSPEGLEKWSVHKRPSKSGSRHARSVIAYYAALWRTIEAKGEMPVPLVIDSPNQGAQDGPHLKMLLTEIATNAPATAQVILAHEESTPQFGADLVHPFESYKRILSEETFGLLSPEMFYYVERAMAWLAQAAVPHSAIEEDDQAD